MRRVATLALLLLLGATASATGGPDGEKEDPAERRARTLLDRVRTLAGEKQMQPAWAGIQALRGELRKTKVVRSAREEIASLRTRVGLAVIGGAISLRATRIEILPKEALLLEYTFEDEAEFGDFERIRHVSDDRFIERKGRVVKGSGMWAFRGIFAGDVTIELDAVLRSERDLGFAVLDPDSAQARFVVAAINNHFFGINYDVTKDRTVGHLLIFCGPGAEARTRYNPSQLYASDTKPYIGPGDRIRTRLHWRGDRLEFHVPPTVLKATLRKRVQVLRRKQPGLHLYQSAIEVKRLVFVGRIDPKWSAEQAAILRRSFTQRVETGGDR